MVPTKIISNISNIDCVVNDQTNDYFADPSREENESNKGSNSSSNRSKPDSDKIIHADAKHAHNGLNVTVTTVGVEEKRKKY